MAKIIAPNKEYNGISAGVQFKNGVGYTDNDRLTTWFEVCGYTVEQNVVSETTNDPVVKPKRKGR